MNSTSCALVVLTPEIKFLIVHPTNAGHLGCWSLPKGLKDVDETPLEAAVRECYEETGLDLRGIHEGQFDDLGCHPYVKGKDLHIFMYQLDSRDKVSDLELTSHLFECNSYFTDRRGNQVTEVDQFAVVNFKEAEKLLNKKQFNIIHDWWYAPQK